MIKLLLILALFRSLFGTDTHFFLPNNHSALIHHLNTYFKNAQNIVIISPAFNHTELKKKIEKSAQKSSKVTLIVANPKGNPLSMIQYQNIDLIVSSVPLNETIFVVDEKIMCSFKGKIDEEEMSSSKQHIRCTDHKEVIAKQYAIVKTLTQKGKPYLE